MRNVLLTVDQMLVCADTSIGIYGLEWAVGFVDSGYRATLDSGMTALGNWLDAGMTALGEWFDC
jgi:hypothetical protein